MAEESVVTKTNQKPERVEKEDLKMFYTRLFPFQEFHSWLSYGISAEDQGSFDRREFSFTLITPEGEEIYVRNQSYTSLAHFKGDITKATPHKLDIGGVYTVPPKQHAAYSHEALRVVEREFVFDIDMDDYSEVRRCCDNGKAKTLCTKCWPFLHIAIQVIQKGLKDLFGFEQCLFVFSGRRGIHCWVADERARKMTSKARQAILDFMIVPVQVSLDKITTQAALKDLHPFLRDIYNDVLLPTFESSILAKQGLLDDEEGQNLILRFVSDIPTREALKKAWEGTNEGESNESLCHHKWAQLKETIRTELQVDADKSQKNRKAYKKRFFSDPVVDIVFAFTYPRFDKNVSIGLNHLLKAPFCIHPGTGKLCVPIDPAKSNIFNPDTVPTLGQMIEELARGEASSMEKYTKLFHTKFLDPILRQSRAVVSDPMDF